MTHVGPCYQKHARKQFGQSVLWDRIPRTEYDRALSALCNWSLHKVRWRCYRKCSVTFSRIKVSGFSVLLALPQDKSDQCWLKWFLATTRATHHHIKLWLSKPETYITEALLGRTYTYIVVWCECTVHPKRFAHDTVFVLFWGSLKHPLDVVKVCRQKHNVAFKCVHRWI